MTIRIATCSCGEIEVRCTGEPLRVSLCHCLDCQRRTGSAFGIAAFFAREMVQTDGSTSSYRRPSDSGFDVVFHFCPDCGATVFWEPQRTPDRIAVAVGAFADPCFPAPEQAVYARHQHTWLDLVDVEERD